MFTSTTAGQDDAVTDSSTVAARSPSRPRHLIQAEVTVERVEPEAQDAVTLFLRDGDRSFDYRAGHFLTIDPHQFSALRPLIADLERAKGKREPPRAYSLASAPHEEGLAISVKEEQLVEGQTLYPPLLSPLLVRALQPGDRLVITGFTGQYTLPDDAEERADHVVHLVAGSGAVPNFSIIKDALHRGLELRHTALCSNKTSRDVFFRRQLQCLERKHPQHLTVLHAITREPGAQIPGVRVRHSRFDENLLREVITDPVRTVVYLCGPAINPWEKRAAKQSGVAPSPRFVESCLEMLDRIGVPKTRVKYESWG